MTQNVSTAVMQRRVEAHDSLDDFPTPPWATRAIIRLMLPMLDERFPDWNSRWTAREPCANRLHMVRPLKEVFDDIAASDIHDYGYDYPVLDYLFPGMMMEAEATFMNPPFRLAQGFIQKSFATPSWCMTAALVRCGFLEGVARWRALYDVTPPTIIAHFTERVVMVKGRLLDPDLPVWNGKELRKPTSATAYCWMVWIKDMAPLPTMWIPPCRKRLTRPGDYPPLPPQQISLQDALKYGGAS